MLHAMLSLFLTSYANAYKGPPQYCENNFLVSSNGIAVVD